MTGIRINPALLNAYEVQRLNPQKFRKLFLAAADGETNLMSKYVVPWNERLNAEEWRELRKAVFQRDDYVCAYCGFTILHPECDHIVPVSRGGSNDMDNLVTACRPCNRSKYNKTLSEWTGDDNA